MNTRSLPNSFPLKLHPLALLFAFWIPASVSVHAQTLLSWNGGALDNPPWVASNISGGNSVGISSTVSSPWGGSDSKSIEIVDASTTNNTTLRADFSPTTDAVKITFDLYSESTGNMPTIKLGESSTAGGSDGLFLNFNNQLGTPAGRKVVNQLNGSGGGDFISSYTVGTWYRVEIITSTIVAGTETFSVSVTPWGGTTTTVDGLSFRNDLDDYGKITFLDNGPGTYTGTFYVTNLSVSAIPEPGSAVLLMGAGAVLAFRRKISER